jgi:hypothetical protein
MPDRVGARSAMATEAMPSRAATGPQLRSELGDLGGSRPVERVFEVVNS